MLLLTSNDHLHAMHLVHLEDTYVASLANSIQMSLQTLSNSKLHTTLIDASTVPNAPRIKNLTSPASQAHQPSTAKNEKQLIYPTVFV